MKREEVVRETERCPRKKEYEREETKASDLNKGPGGKPGEGSGLYTDRQSNIMNPVPMSFPRSK